MRKLLLFLLIGGIGITFWAYSIYSSALKYQLSADHPENISLTIPQGANADDIASLLKEEKLISSTAAFKYYLKQKKLDQDLKSGGYVFSTDQTLPQIAQTLVEGGKGENSLTLLEGWTADQIGEYLQEKGITSKKDFLRCFKSCDFDFDFLPPSGLEGYLYPDTYFVDESSFTNRAFIQRLLENFEKKFSEDDWSALEASDRSLEEIIVMASIVEREERLPKEKATVAGILWNRLDNGMRLDADATVLYALGRTEGGLDYEDLQVNSPYNTRKQKGLPPTAICNPSIESIRAALYPKETDYLYYLHDANGRVHYAKTLEGHNRNKAKYLD